MSFLSFLSSHRLHSSHRPWIEPLSVRFDIIAHEHPSEEDASDLVALIAPVDAASTLIVEGAPIVTEPPAV